MARTFPFCSKASVWVGIVALALLPGAAASAKVFASQKDALKTAFPEASRIERETHLLGRAKADEIEAITGEEVEAKVIVIHTAYKGDAVLGYAQIDVHNVRTQPEAFMIVLTPDGHVRSVRILAFHEPVDYLPTERWYAQFEGKSSDDGLRVGRDIHGVVGATLSARAATDGVRRMLAYWEVLLRPAEVGTQAP
jgi:Na+-translocating ferredoxin:NAD+ oxidoreductase RnfG subunit